MLTQHLACPTFAQAITAKSTSCLLDFALPLRRAQKLTAHPFGHPKVAARKPDSGKGCAERKKLLVQR